MRDLIIWNIALRLAQHDGEALLLSRDVVHVHPRGDAEASAANLIRLCSIDDVLEYMGVQTPAGNQMEQLLSPAWEALREAGLPLGAAPTLISVVGPTFVQGVSGLASASCAMKVRVDESAVLSGLVQIDFPGNDVERVQVSNARVAGGALLPTVEVEIASLLTSEAGQITERYDDLLEVLEENE